MNSKETPLEQLQARSDSGLMVIDEVNKEDGPLTSDVNENKVDGEKGKSVNKNEGIRVQSTDAQDSINNNENCNLMCGQLSCKKSYEDSERTVAECVPSSTTANRDAATAKEKRISGKRTNRSRKNCNGKSTGFASVSDAEPLLESKSLESTCELVSTLDPNIGAEQRNQKQLRDSLFSLIREGFEQTNVRMLPLCLHQIAETYFQEEDYENAMQFIQLERTYHEQLLANLSAIQEQWETKWKNTDSTSLLLPTNPDRELSRKEIERLSYLCGSHQDPKISKHKLSATERSLKIQSLTQLIGSDAVHDVDCVAAEIESQPGSKSTKDGKPGVTAMTENSQHDTGATGDVSKAADHQTVVGLGHTEEQQQQKLLSSSDTSETHAQSTGTEGRANTVSLCSGDTVKNNKILQPDATPHCKEASEIEAFPKDHWQVQPGTPGVDKLISAGTDYADIASVAQEDLHGENSIGCGSIKQNAQVADSTEEHCIQDVKESLVRNSLHAENTQGSTCDSSLSTIHQKCSQDTERAGQREATVEFIASLLNGDIKDSEHFLAHLDFQEETFSEEEMSPSPGDTILGDNLLSLDELAKRIEVEEVHPASGLVSILKKRNEREGEKVGQPPAKQTKRKVRFQEADDVLDQEEIGGGSCILLVILCLATVFLSVGGTALYCTFGDEESSVCKDFAANMDFYYTQTLQGIEELKHWLSVT